MSKTNNMSKTNPNPTQKDVDADQGFYDINNMASCNEFTGLIPSGIVDPAEAEAYSTEYGIHEQKVISDANIEH